MTKKKSKLKKNPVECHVFFDIPAMEVRDELRVLAKLPESAKVYCYRRESHRADVFVVELRTQIEDSERSIGSPEAILGDEVKLIKKLLKERAQ